MSPLNTPFTNNAYVIAGLALIVASVIFVILATGTRLPRYRPVSIMTGNEREFFARLRHALPEYFVFPQVAMSALIAPVVPSRHRGYRAAFARISQKRVDYAIFDRNLNLVCVVELDDRTHDAKKDAVRDALLSSAGVRTVRWTSKNKPDVAAIIAGVIPPPPEEQTARAGR